MRKALLFLPLAFALVACGPTGCDTFGKIANPTTSVGQGQVIDEQALGMAYTAAATANIGIARLAPFMSAEQVKLAQEIKGRYTQGIKAAEAAKTAVDATSYSAKIGAVKAAIDELNVLLNSVKAR